MAFNLSKISNTFRRKVSLYLSNTKGTDDVVTVTCDFLRRTKDEVQQIQDRIDEAQTNGEREAIIMAVLDEVWTGWDVVDDAGPKPFTHESRAELFNLLPGTMIEIYLAWVKGCSGRDRKNV
ncbi:MAG: hypothetical protein LBI35_01280 [Burkholderiales bacterium]|nr:hypothetical protein [Burkholderiales bacterium]